MKKGNKNLCSISFPRIQFSATNIVALAIVPVYDDARALEDESYAWSRDDLHQVSRERINLLFDCEREIFDNVVLQENIICYTRSQISRSAYEWSQIQAERSTREPLNSIRTCFSRQSKGMISFNQYDISNNTSIYFTSNYHLSRIVRRERCTSKQHRRCCALLQFKYAEDSNAHHCKCIANIFKVIFAERRSECIRDLTRADLTMTSRAIINFYAII